MNEPDTSDLYESEIAIIGLTGRFPGSKSIAEFWQNLCAGVESITFFSDQDLEPLGLDPAVLHDPNYVKAGAILEDIELFDATFFDIAPRDAEITDPQHRIFLECAWEALENAGYDAETYEGLIGVYAGTSVDFYRMNNLESNRHLLESATLAQFAFGNFNDHLCTRVSYKLDLRGPSVTVQTACSTSLVAAHLACQSLLNGECDIALAGGVCIPVPQKSGYLYKEGGVKSPDGHCRAFDANAQGTAGGSGIGIVVLKRLQDALTDGDCIHAVIKGSAINNDGAQKVGYAAPSVDGQAEVIADALHMAKVEPETVTYVETHGTGTPLGDPIEIAALTQAFRAGTDKKGFCAIGSLKPNIGHLDTAAGVAGMIKVVLALKHKTIPPSLNCQEPNPKIDFANSPFFVNITLSEWKAGNTPRRAGVSSFGMGGTNAHVVLEQAPEVEPSGESRPWQLLVLSAKTGSALDAATVNLASHLERHPDLNLADVAYTLQVGRRAFSYRRMLVCRDLGDAVTALETLDPQRILSSFQDPKDRPILFMFPGQGAQYVNMALELYQEEPTFSEQVDLCAELLQPHLGLDLRDVLYPRPERAQEAARQLEQTALAQPALFVVEYALAKLWMEWGMQPRAMIGHSIGEYVAACLAGVLSLEDALALVAARGRLMQEMPEGAMLSVALSEKEVQPFLNQDLALAAVNAPSFCVISGPTDAIIDLEHQLAQRGLEHRRLHTSHAFHSGMMDAIVQPFAEAVKQVNLQPPQIPCLSNVTGDWITAAEATDPTYWARHLRQPVRFADGIRTLLKEPDWVLLEVGPGRSLSTFVKQQLDKNAEQIVLTSLRHPQEQFSDVQFLLNTLGRLWLAAMRVDWSGVHAHEQRRRIPLPTYPFERQRYWIEPKSHGHEISAPAAPWGKKLDVANWFYSPVWKQAPLPVSHKPDSLEGRQARWLFFLDECGLGVQIVKRLEQEQQFVVTVMAGDQFARSADHTYVLNPQRYEDYTALVQELGAHDEIPDRVVHLWSVTGDRQTRSKADLLAKSQDMGFYSLVSLVQAFERRNVTDALQIHLVSNDMQQVTGLEGPWPEKATVLGACQVIPQEYPHIICRSIDIALPSSASWQKRRLISQLVAELESSEKIVAYRGGHRWKQTFEPVQFADKAECTPRLRTRGVYLITGELDVALVYAEYLAKTVQAKLALVERSAFPPKAEWKQWLAAHDDEDHTSRQIRKVQSLEELGSEILMVSADVANPEQMQKVIAQTGERFGEIHGVIHAAQVAGKELVRVIDQIDRTECALRFQQNVGGLLVLKEILEGQPLDFCIVHGSLPSILGGTGLAADVATSRFVQALACQHNQASPAPWTVVSWDRWAAGDGKSAPGDGTFTITAEESVQAIQYVLSVENAPHIVVSTRDLQARLDRRIECESGEAACAEPKASSARSRLNLGAYVAPRDDLEQTIAGIWQELLGIDQVGIYDNFFELGGHSLMATQLVSRLRETFPVELPLRSLFLERPTVAALAEAIDEMLTEKIEALSEDEAQGLL